MAGVDNTITAYVSSTAIHFSVRTAINKAQLDEWKKEHHDVLRATQEKLKECTGKIAEVLGIHDNITQEVIGASRGKSSSKERLMCLLYRQPPSIRLSRVGVCKVEYEPIPGYLDTVFGTGDSGKTTNEEQGDSGKTTDGTTTKKHQGMDLLGDAVQDESWDFRGAPLTLDGVVAVGVRLSHPQYTLYYRMGCNSIFPSSVGGIPCRIEDLPERFARAFAPIRVYNPTTNRATWAYMAIQLPSGEKVVAVPEHLLHPQTDGNQWAVARGEHIGAAIHQVVGAPSEGQDAGRLGLVASVGASLRDDVAYVRPDDDVVFVNDTHHHGDFTGIFKYRPLDDQQQLLVDKAEGVIVDFEAGARPAHMDWVTSWTQHEGGPAVWGRADWIGVGHDAQPGDCGTRVLLASDVTQIVGFVVVGDHLGVDFVFAHNILPPGAQLCRVP